MKKCVYLSGPITGLSHDEARLSWRKDVFETLTPLGIDCLSPMRFESHLEGIDEISAAGYSEHVLGSPRGIVARDRYDTLRCDIVLCNLLGAKRVSIGTMIEIGWCDSTRTPLILCMESEGNAHQHAMVVELADFIVPTIEAGVEVVKTILIPGT